MHLRFSCHKFNTFLKIHAPGFRLEPNLQALHSLINRLEDIEKAIILLWLDEYSYDEIADTLGLKRNTVATKIHRIKDKLSKQI